MIYHVYMLKSLSKNSVTYVGYTNNLKKESIYIIIVKVQSLLGVENGSYLQREIQY